MGIKITALNFEELVAAEQSANVVRKNYEDKMVIYRGVDYNDAMSEKERSEYAELSKKLSLINGIRINILNEMERKLTDIDCE